MKLMNNNKRLHFILKDDFLEIDYEYFMNNYQQDNELKKIFIKIFSKKIYFNINQLKLCNLKQNKYLRMKIDKIEELE